MARPVKMPPLGQASDELRLLEWLVAEGAEVSEGAPLFEVETDKATLEVEAAFAGTLLKTLCSPGETVRTGTTVAWIGEPGDDIPETKPAEVALGMNRFAGVDGGGSHSLARLRRPPLCGVPYDRMLTPINPGARVVYPARKCSTSCRA